MRLFRRLLVILLALFCGCARDDEMVFTKGKGELGKFILQQSLKRGARPVTSQNLPIVGGDWTYSEDQYGIVLRCAPERFPEVQTFLLQAFGPPTQQATSTTDGGKLGWYRHEPIGVYIQFGYDSRCTQVTILFPQLDSAPREASSKANEE